MGEAVEALKRIFGEIARDNEDIAIAAINAIAELSILPREVTADICVDVFGSIIDAAYNGQTDERGPATQMDDEIPSEVAATAREFGVPYV